VQSERICLDTNIIISAAIKEEGIPSEVFKKVLKSYQHCITREILLEVKLVLNRPRLSIPLVVQNRFMRLLLQSLIVVPTTLTRICKDPTDDKFIDCALAAGADIVSGDKHLLELKEYKGVKIYSAREFLDAY